MQGGVFIYAAGLFLLGAPVFGEPVQTSSVLDGGGRAYSNATFAGVGAVGQGTPPGFNANPSADNYSGFLQTYVARPDLDNDQDGIVDENDTDDDNDGLTDTGEVTGSGFDPVTGTDLFDADTDDDGAGDGEESVAGTNPQDAGSLLEIVLIEMDGANEMIEWKSRQGKTYEVLRANTLFDFLTAAETAEVVTATSGGVGPFLETTTSSTQLGSGDRTYYGVHVLP